MLPSAHGPTPGKTRRRIAAAELAEIQKATGEFKAAMVLGRGSRLAADGHTQRRTGRGRPILADVGDASDSSTRTGHDARAGRVRRDKRTRTTIAAKDGIRAGDLLNRDFTATASDYYGSSAPPRRRQSAGAGAVAIGSRLPLHATGVDKVLLAYAAEEVQAEVLADLARVTPYTVTQPGRLREQLRRVHCEGFAQTSEEMSPGACSVAVPIRSPDDRVVAALGIVVPSLKRDRPMLVTALQVAAQGIGRSIPS